MSLVKKIPNYLKVILLTVLNLLILVTVILVLFEYPKVESIKNIQIDKIANDSVYISVNTIINNNNFFSIKGEQINLNSYYKEKKIGNGIISDGLDLKAKSKNKIKSNLKISLNELSVLWNDFVHEDSIILKLLTSGKFNPFKINLNHSEEILLDTKTLISKLLEESFNNKSITISNFKLSKMSLQKFKWKFDINTKNEQPFDVVIREIDIKIYPEKKSKSILGKWKLKDENLLLKSNDEATINAELEITLSGFLNTLVTKMKKFSGNLYLRSLISIEINNHKFKIPYQQKLLFNPLKQEITIVK